MHVHILYTGGTLGMIETDHGLAPGADLESWLDRLLDGTNLGSNVTMTTFDHLIDSSNATPDDWAHIIDELWAHHDEADAFIVLHGTDTMAYTSSAVSFALTDFDKPVIFTGAQYPLSVIGSDAEPNVTGAIRAAASDEIYGVTLFFGHMLLMGNRATKVSTWAYRGFDSPSIPQLARTGAPWQWTPRRPRGGGWSDPKPFTRHDVPVIEIAPGLTAKRLAAMLDPLPEAVILRALGVGNVPSEEPGLTDVLRETIAAGVPMVVSSQCYQPDVLLGHYDAGYALLEAGAVGTGDMTPEAAYTKLIFLLSQGLSPDQVASHMTRDIAGEITIKHN